MDNQDTHMTVQTYMLYYNKPIYDLNNKNSCKSVEECSCPFMGCLTWKTLYIRYQTAGEFLPFLFSTHEFCSLWKKRLICSTDKTQEITRTMTYVLENTGRKVHMESKNKSD